MDQVIHPDARKWISPSIHLGKAVEELRIQAKRMERECIIAANFYTNDPGVFQETDESRTNMGATSSSNSRKNGVISSSQSKISMEPTNSAQSSSVPSTLNAQASSDQSSKDITDLMTHEQKTAAEEMAQSLNRLLGGNLFFDIKLEEQLRKKEMRENQRRRKNKKDKSMDQDEDLETDYTAPMRFNGSNVLDRNDSDGSQKGYQPPGVTDYFSDFSNLSEDSEDDDIDDFDDPQYNNRFSQYEMRVLSRYPNINSSDEENSDDNDCDQSVEGDKDENESNPHASNEEIDEEEEEGPSGKRAKFASDLPADSKQEPMDDYNGEKTDTEASEENLNPVSDEGVKGKAPPEMKGLRGEEQFKKFMKRVLRKKTDAGLFHGDKDGIQKMMGISNSKYKELSDSMNVNLVSVLGETIQEERVVEGSVMPVLAPPLPDSAKSQLQSLAIFVTHGDDPTGFQWRSNNVQQQINDDILNIAFLERMKLQKLDYEEKDCSELVDKEYDFVIEISVYQAGDPDETLPDDVKSRGAGGARGFARSDGDSTPSISGPTRYVEPKLAYKLEILGSQTVAELRDSLHCENDLMCVKEVEHPDKYQENPDDLAKNVFPTAALIIGETVYSDMRKPGCINFTKGINDWASTPPEKNIGPFMEGDLVSTKLRDLTVRFGYPYVYMHMGNCEHIVVFNKTRLLELKDEHRLSKYPKIIASSTFKTIYCRVDNECLAKWAVLDCIEFPEDPMMVCTDCLKSYLYDRKGVKRGNFRVYPFRQLANEL